VSVRNHGLGESPNPVSPPKVIDAVPGPCPNCKGKTLYLIRVELEGRHNIGTYAGCAACPYASPMLSTNGGKREKSERLLKAIEKLEDEQSDLIPMYTREVIEHYMDLEFQINALKFELERKDDN